MRFPQFDELNTLTTYEHQALRSLNAAFLAARYEWQTACTLWDRLSNTSSAVQLTTATTPFPFHKNAVDEIVGGVNAYERHTALTAWRYTAAALVLGVAVLQRIAEEEPPLTAAVVEELCQEPTLGRLHKALAVPVADLVPARMPDGTSTERDATALRWAKVRDGVDYAMDVVLEIAADENADHPRTKDEAATCLLTQHCPPHTDPVYEGLLEPLFRLAEAVPFDISWILVKR